MTDGQVNLLRNRVQLLPGAVLLITPNQDAIPRTMSCLLTNMNLKNENVITFEREIFFKNEHFLQIETKDFSNDKLLTTLYETASLDVDVLMIDDIKMPRVLKEVLEMAFRIPKIYCSMTLDTMKRAIEMLFKVGEDPTSAFLNTNVIIFQQPIPLLCPYCKQPVHGEKFGDVFGGALKDVQLYKPAGCERCNQTGYQRTISFFEILPVSHEVRELAFMDIPVAEKVEHIYDVVNPKMDEFIVDELKKGAVFWGDIKRFLNTPPTTGGI